MLNYLSCTILDNPTKMGKFDDFKKHNGRSQSASKDCLDKFLVVETFFLFHLQFFE